MQNDWMKDESLKNIDPYKLEFLQALMFESSNLKRADAPFFNGCYETRTGKKSFLLR